MGSKKFFQLSLKRKVLIRENEEKFSEKMNHFY